MDINAKPEKTSAVGHWRYQRYTAVALLPLTIWLLILLNLGLHAPYAETLAWVSAPLNSIAVSLWIIGVTYHAALGVQVVLEDYVSNLKTRQLAVLASNLAFLALGGAAISALIITLVR